MFFRWKAENVMRMTLVAMVIACGFIGVGIVGLVAPRIFVWIGQGWATPVGLYLFAALRVASGVVLIGVARASRSPVGLGLFGSLLVVSGGIAPLLGIERVRTYIDWWLGHGETTMRAWALIALTIGILIGYAVAPHRPSRVPPAPFVVRSFR